MTRQDVEDGRIDSILGPGRDERDEANVRDDGWMDAGRLRFYRFSRGR